MTRVLVPLAVSPSHAGSDRQAVVDQFHGATMGTSWSARVVRPEGLAPDAIRPAIANALDEVVWQMSHWDPDSQLSRFNNAAAGEWRDLPHGFNTVLRAALEAAEMTRGAFDPAIGPLVDLWGFGPAPARTSPPLPDEIAAARTRSGWRRIDHEPGQGRARQPGGARLDFSGIAKGFAVDCAAHALERLGVRHFLVEVGGELRGAGVKPDGTPWWVALERPPEHDTGEPDDTLVALHGLSIATSGDYRRYFESDGRRYSHSLDPRTGYPVDNGMISATVIHPDCMWADAFATALTVLGFEDGLAFAERHALAALLVKRTAAGCQEALSSALAAMLD